MAPLRCGDRGPGAALWVIRWELGDPPPGS